MILQKRIPAEPWVGHQPHPWNSLRVPAAQSRGDFLLPPSHSPEEALHFLKLEHEVLSPGFFRRFLPFMLHQLLEAFVWNENIWKKPLQVSPPHEGGFGAAWLSWG